MKKKARPNPKRAPIDHKFAGSLFSAGEPKVALAYLRGTMAKGTARELVAAKLKKARPMRREGRPARPRRQPCLRDLHLVPPAQRADAASEPRRPFLGAEEAAG